MLTLSLSPYEGFQVGRWAVVIFIIERIIVNILIMKPFSKVVRALPLLLGSFWIGRKIRFEEVREEDGEKFEVKNSVLMDQLVDLVNKKNEEG